jgi:hypothetical protein
MEAARGYHLSLDNFSENSCRRNGPKWSCLISNGKTVSTFTNGNFFLISGFAKVEKQKKGSSSGV